MKIKSSMWFVVPILIIFLVLCVLVATFALDNNEKIKLRYHIPLTSFHIPKLEEGKPDFIETYVIYIILISILIGIAIMIVFVAIAGLGWRYYVLKNRARERKERKVLWDQRERAIAMSLMGFHQDALALFEHIIDKEHPHVELYVGIAEAFEREGDHQKAIESYNSILARHPDNMRSLFGAAENWEALGNYSEAIKLYNRVLDVDRASPKAIQKVQELLEQSSRYAEAIEAYQRSRSTLDSQETQEILASLYYRLAIQQIKEGDLKAAEQTLKDSRKEYDFYVPSMLILANLYMNTGRERDARRLWENTAEHTLSTIIFRRLEDYYYNQKGNPQDNLEPVIKLYKRLIETQEANHLRLALGKLYLKLEIFDEAERILMEFQSKDPSIPQVHLLLADLYHRADKIDKALEEYRFSAELVDIKIADFKCFKCGAMYEYWADQCTSCKSWGSIEDIFFTKGPKSVLPELKQRPLPQLPTPGEAETEEKVVSVS
jgi:lipopolysaccharide biosynthesis regulator YciM